MRKITGIVWVLFFLIFSFNSNAKEYPMLHYTIEDGLPSNVIYDIYQDANGFIWVGTDKGVARFNGQKFESFTSADGLSDNECFFFQPDHFGRLWIGTYNGELCYYKDGKFHNSVNTPWLKLSFKASITCFIKVNNDSSINIFFKDHPGFLEINKETIQHFTPAIMQVNPNDFHCINVQKKSNNTYDIYYANRIVTIDAASNILKTKVLDRFSLMQMVNGDKGSIFVTQENTYLTKNFELINLNGISNNSSVVINRFEQNGNGYVVATTKGLYIKGSAPLFSQLNIHDALIDNEGNFWAGSAANGIYKIDKEFATTQKIQGVFAMPIAYAQTTAQHLFFADKGRNTFRIKKNSEKVESIFNFSTQNGIENRLDCIHWIKEGIYYNFSNNNNFRITNIDAVNVNVKKLKTDNLGGLNGVYYTDSFVYLRDRMFFDIARPKDVSSNDTLPFFRTCLRQHMEAIYGSDVDRNKQFWSSSLEAIYKIVGYERYAQPQFRKTSFRQFVFFKDYMIGVSHHNELLVCRNYEGNNIKIDTLRSGDCVWDRFYKLNDTALLISTNNYFRLLTIDDKNGNRNYNIRMLEKAQIPYQPEFIYIDSSTSYFFKQGALTSFPNNYILGKDKLPVIKMLSLKTKDSNFLLNEKISLTYFQGTSLNILFTAISFNHKNLSYEYSVSSNDSSDKWIAIIGEELNLFKIGFGKFIIKVRAKTMSGEYSEPAAFELLISKPFWATYWFIGACLLFGIALIAFAARLGIRQTLNKKEKEVRFLRSEYKALNALMNPHFIFNSLNSVQSLINNNENKTASKYIRIFSDLIRQNMRNISQELISLSKEMDLVENYLRIEQLRFKERLNYSIEIDDVVEMDLIMVPPLLIQPLVENAIKHGVWPKKATDGFVQIKIHEEGDFLLIEIKDNGIGLNKETKSDTLHESYAMSNIYKRIEQLSLIHQTIITVEISEIIANNNTIEGVRSLIKIDISNHSK